METHPSVVRTNEGKPLSSKIYPVPHGQSERVARVLQEIYAGDPHFRVVVIGDERLLVRGTPEQHTDIDWPTTDRQNRVIKMFRVKSLNVQELAEALKVTFPSPTYVEADVQLGAILVRGSKVTVGHIEGLLLLLDRLYSARD